MRQRQVEVEPLALAGAALVGVAEEIGIFDARVGVDVHHLHVGAGVEDRLGAVAVVVVDVEDADPAEPAAAQPFRGDGGVVDEAIAAGGARPGVVAGRAAEREGGALAAADEGGGGQRDVVARLHRVPGAGDEGGAGVHAVEAEEPVDVLGRHVGAQPVTGQTKGIAVPPRPLATQRGQASARKAR